MSKRLVVYSSKLHRGGAEKHLVLLMNELSRMGYEIHLVLTQRGGSYERLLSDAVKIYSSRASFRSYTIALVAGAFQLWKVLRKVRPSISYSIQDGPNIINLLTGKLAGADTVARIVEVQNNPENELSKNSLLKLYFRICKAIYPQSDGFISLSKGVQQAYLRAIPRLAEVKKQVIHNIGCLQTNGSLRRKASDTWRVLAVGRLTPQKDYGTLIEAVHLLRRNLVENRMPVEVKLDILGDGELKNDLQRLVSERELDQQVFFHGFVDNIDEFYQRADLFILSSRWEGFGNVIVEAMAKGIPVIATNCDFGPSEIIEHPGLQGLLVPVGDAEAIAQGIMSVMTDVNLYEKLSREGLRRAADFSAREIALRYDECFQSMSHG